MAKIHYEADGVHPADRFIAALTDFSERRPELWPNLDDKYYELHDLGTDVGRRDRGDRRPRRRLGEGALRLVGTRDRPPAARRGHRLPARAPRSSTG